MACLIIACSKLFPLHLIPMVFGVTLFDRHLRLKTLAVLDLASFVPNLSNSLASSKVLWL